MGYYELNQVVTSFAAIIPDMVPLLESISKPSHTSYTAVDLADALLFFLSKLQGLQEAICFYLLQPTVQSTVLPQASANLPAFCQNIVSRDS